MKEIISKISICEYETTYQAVAIEDVSTDVRTDSVLISLIKELGLDVNGLYSDIYITEISDTLNYVIRTDCDGLEFVDTN